MKTGRGLSRLILLLFGLLMVTAWFQQAVLERSLSRQMTKALAVSGEDEVRVPASDSMVKLLQTGEMVSTKEMRSVLKRVKTERMDSFMVWTFKGIEGVSATAMGTDRQHHFVNAFLEGYRPFPVDHPWMPLYAIAMRLQYQLDAKQYAGLEDVWQTSRQAFVNTRGDCEDHAILLADWLIGSGFEARVVVGRIPTGGHAWVVAFMDGQEFLLEATSKRKRRQWRHYPLASLASDYIPTLMFDRESFWVNTGPPEPGSYNGDRWEKRSRFYPGNG